MFKNGDEVDPRAEEFEKEFLKVVEKETDRVEAEDPDIVVER